MKEKTKGLKESKKTLQISLKEKRRLKKERKNRWAGKEGNPGDRVKLLRK